MRAVWVGRAGGLEALVDAALPLPAPGPGQVRVRVVCAGFNPVDAAWRRGEHLPPLPGVLGRDFSGVVDAVGEALDPRAPRFEVGDAVLGYAGRASNGTYAEHLCLPVELLGAKPEHLGFEHAAALPVAWLTAARIRSRLGPLDPELDDVFVTGASGAVGSLLIEVLRGEGLAVSATTSSDPGARHLRALGVAPERIVRVDRGGPEDWARAAKARVGPATHLVDLAGGALKNLCFALAPVDGDVLSVVEEPPDFSLNLWDERTSPLVRRSLRFAFVQLGSTLLIDQPARWSGYGRGVGRAAEAAAQGRLSTYLSGVSSVGPLGAEAARAAHRKLESGAVRGKLVMRVSDP